MSYKLFLILITLILLILFIWIFITLDNQSNNFDYENLDPCGNPISKINNIKEIKENKINKIILEKFVQAENEIDTLCRSYIIETLCSCQEACITFQRIEYLCDRIGEYLGNIYNRTYGIQYGAYRKKICQEFKKCVDEKETDNEKWLQEEERFAKHIADHNKCMSREFLIRTRIEHCKLLCRLIDEHIEKKTLEGMIIYDAVKEKTDAYLEHMTSSIYQC